MAQRTKPMQTGSRVQVCNYAELSNQNHFLMTPASSQKTQVLAEAWGESGSGSSFKFSAASTDLPACQSFCPLLHPSSTLRCVHQDRKPSRSSPLTCLIGSSLSTIFKHWTSGQENSKNHRGGANKVSKSDSAVFREWDRKTLMKSVK